MYSLTGALACYKTLDYKIEIHSRSNVLCAGICLSEGHPTV